MAWQGPVSIYVSYVAAVVWRWWGHGVNITQWRLDWHQEINFPKITWLATVKGLTAKTSNKCISGWYKSVWRVYKMFKLTLAGLITVSHVNCNESDRKSAAFQINIKPSSTRVSAWRGSVSAAYIPEPRNSLGPELELERLLREKAGAGRRGDNSWRG